MRLTGAQVTRIQEALDRYFAQKGSQGVRTATATLVEDVLVIVGKSAPAPKREVA